MPPRAWLQDVTVDGVDLVGSSANRRQFALLKATWDAAYVNALPDSSFAYVAGSGDSKERHLPYKDKDGKVDLPHLRNALARLDQTQIPDAAKAAAKKTLEAAAKTAGVGSGDDTHKSTGDEPMKLSTIEFRKRLATTLDGAADMPEAELAEFAKALGIELTADKKPAEPDTKELEKSLLARILRGLRTSLGGEPDAEPDVLPFDKSKLAPEVATYMAGLEKRIKATETAEQERLAKALQARAEKLQKAGWIDKNEDLSTITEPEVAAIEKAQSRVIDRLKKAGVLESFGTPRQASEPGNLRDYVAKAVEQYLGHEPVDKAEEVRAKQVLYKANPGLQQAVLAEERAAKRGAGAAVSDDSED